jgi:hypothetical protein
MPPTTSATVPNPTINILVRTLGAIDQGLTPRISQQYQIIQAKGCQPDEGSQKPTWQFVRPLQSALMQEQE